MSIKLSVVLPCRNEEQSLKYCIDTIKDVFKANHIEGEIIVSDSSSDDAKIRDVHCGMRAFQRKVLQEIDFKTTGMEFASEMLKQALQHQLKIKELPINYHQRKGLSKLRTFADGWRHLKFMLTTQSYEDCHIS